MTGERKMRLDGLGTYVPGSRIKEDGTRNAHAVVVGINRYADDRVANLGFARADAERFAEILSDRLLGRFPADNVQLLVDEAATRDGIISAVGTGLSRSARPDDLVCVFFAGHGATEPDRSAESSDGLAKYLLPCNANVDDLYTTAIDMRQISDFFKRIESNQIVFFLDACHSGGADGFATRSIPTEDFLHKLAAGGEGRVVLTSCKPNELSLERADLGDGHGLYSHYLLKGLEGAADLDGDGVVTLDELYQYVSEHVPDHARRLGGRMSPIRTGTVQGKIYLTSTEALPWVREFAEPGDSSLVTSADAASMADVEVGGEPAQPVSGMRRRLVKLLPVAVVAGTVAIAGTWMLSRILVDGGAADSPDGVVLEEAPLDRDLIAVLSFEYPDQASSFFALSLSESLSNELSKVHGLRVVPTDSVRGLESRGIPRDSIQRLSAAGWLVTGSVSGRSQLTISLFGVEEDGELYTRQVDGPDVVALRNAAMHTLREWLGSELQVSQELIARAEAAAELSDSLDAGGDSVLALQNRRTADSLLTLAEEWDVQSPEAPTRRAWLAYKVSRSMSPYTGELADSTINAGLSHAERAISLDPNAASALEARGTLRYWRYLLNLDPEDDPMESVGRARADLEAAVSLDPGLASAWAAVSHLYLNIDEAELAKSAAMRAINAAPLERLPNEDDVLRRLYYSSYDLEDRNEAAHWCGLLVLRHPENPLSIQCQLWLMTISGGETDVDRAWALADEYVALASPQRVEFDRRWAGMGVAAVLALEGMADSARAVAERSRADEAVDPFLELKYFEAFVRTVLGDNDEALDLLTEFMAVSPDVAIIDDWWFNGLREEPRYQALLGTGATQ